MPKLYTLTVEDIFKNINLDNRGLIINGERLNHLKYADDVVLITDNPTDLQELLTALKQESEKIRLKINIEKKMSRNRENQVLQIQLEGKNIESVDKYVYLRQQITVGKDMQTLDLNRKNKMLGALLEDLTMF